MDVKFVKLDPKAKMPTRGSEKAAGYDLYVSKDTLVRTGRTIIPTDIAIQLPDGYHAQVRPRSGFSAKGFEGCSIQLVDVKNRDNINGYRIITAYETQRSRFDADVLLGTLDSDYRGGIGVIVRNADVPFIAKAGTRIAQLVVCSQEECNFVEVDQLDDTERGDGGFGHTGTK